MRFKSSLLLSASTFWNGPDLVHVHARRERRMLMLGSLAMSGMGTAWGIYFLTIGYWPLIGMDVVLVLGGLGVAALAWHRRNQAAAILFFTTLFIVVFVIAWVFDAATPQAPRTTHLYLLALSVAALMTFRDSNPWLRHGIAVTCLVAMGVLSISYGSPLPQYALPEHVRAFGAWVQMIASLSLYYGMLQIMRTNAVIRSNLENDLRHAIVQEQFHLHFQPQLDARGRVVGAEALLRWLHPERGWVMPGQFIEMAEQTGLILPIGRWVLRMACKQLRSWSEQAEFRHLRLAVNVSQFQFRQDDFATQVLSMIDRYGIDAQRLELELTESMLAKDLPDIIQKMTLIRARGVTFSLDDFGTGYSSLNYLKRLPLHQLKIDQSFVRDILTDPNDASIARTVVTLGHDLGLTVIAEGVESQAQKDYLSALGCDLFQGYLFSRAIPIDEFNAFVTAASNA